jgi:tyrosyl-tRNA synthetase
MQEYWSKQAARIKAGAQKSMLSVLEERGLVKDIAGYVAAQPTPKKEPLTPISGREALDYVLTAKPVGVYVGVDPTAPSLHVGHLLPLMVLYWMYLYGFPAVSLVSGPDRRTGLN